MKIPGSTSTNRLTIAAILLAGAQSLRAPLHASDAHALSRIFGDEQLATNVLAVCSQASALPPEDRYGFLADWVLPGEHRPTFRVVADFSPTHPPPIPGNPQPSGFRVPSGGEIVSPVLDLIESATALGRLDGLRRRVDATIATSAETQIDRMALLALIDIAREDVPAAQSSLTNLFAIVTPEGDTPPVRHDGALLCVHTAAGHAEISRTVFEAAHRIADALQKGGGTSAWQRQFTAAYARVSLAASNSENSSETPHAASPGQLWHPGSLPRARWRGAGIPAAQWSIASGRVDSLSSHHEDFLYFAVPLRGNFEVEGDVTGFGWRETQLLLAGQWVGLVYDLESFDVGNIDGSAERVRFAPSMMSVDDEIHYRAVVRDGIETTFFNGRPLHVHSLSADHDPWLAVRSGPYNDGGVRDVRVTGDPVVSETLQLSAADNLAGWIPYYEEFSGVGWRQPAGSVEIHGPLQRAVPRGCHLESALFYHRPLLEDGSIEYEFWYEAGRCEAHPVLDRLCFLLDPDSVRIHWLTDGPFDRTGLPPDNLFDEPDHQRGPPRLPLRDGEWNQLRLNVRGDTVDLLVNNRLVFQRQLEPTNQRNFGLFHYADRTELRVRNVTWHGDWPRQIPELNDQELYANETGWLDERLPELTAVFAHDFAGGGLPLDRFAVIQGDPSENVATRPDGLLAIREAEGGYRNTTVAPLLRVSGDFDITASFQQLATDPRGSGSSDIYLNVLADNQSADECRLLRRGNLGQGYPQQLVQCVRVYQTDRQPRHHYFNHRTVEALAGTFRLARRGARVYYLFAENDSRQFRLIGQEDFPADDLQWNGIRLAAQIYGDGGSISVVWTDLTVRAEDLSGPAVDSVDHRLVKLNIERSLLAQSFELDLTRTPPDAVLISRWSDFREWNKDAGGLLIVATGADNWTSAGAALLRQIEGDFDISVGFDALRLDTPAEQDASAVYLQVELADKEATRAHVIFQKTSDGAFDVKAQYSLAGDPSARTWQHMGQLSLTSAHGLRLARRGRRIVCIVDSDEFGGERIVSEADVGDAPVAAGNTQIFVHTGGAGRESHVLWKSLEVHAERIAP